MSALLPEAPHIVVTIHHPNFSPTDEEWEENLQKLREAHQAPADFLAQLVFTNGSGPNAKQRNMAAEGRKTVSKPFRCAVVSSSPLARGIITALGWLGVDGLRSYSPLRTGEALAYLGYTGNQESLKTFVANLVTDMDGGPRASLLQLL